MTTHTQTEHLTDLLEKARQEGGVYIRRDDGVLFLLKPETQATHSPLDVEGVDTQLTLQEILEAIQDGAAAIAVKPKKKEKHEYDVYSNH